MTKKQMEQFLEGVVPTGLVELTEDQNHYRFTHVWVPRGLYAWMVRRLLGLEKEKSPS